MGNLCLTREKAFIGDKLPGLRDFEGMTYEEGGTLLNTKPPTEVLTTIKKIGKGMFGEVWEAVDRRDGTKVAVKIIHITSEEHANLISLEVGTMLHCQGHPNITEVYGLYTDSAWSELCIFDGPRMWIVQQLIDPGDGPGSLFNLLTEKKENNRTTTTDDVMVCFFNASQDKQNGKKKIKIRLLLENVRVAFLTCTVRESSTEILNLKILC